MELHPIGVKNGILVRLNLFNDGVTCTPHKVNLAAQKTSGPGQQKTVKATVKTVEGVGSDFWASSKRTQTFERLQEAYGEKLLRPVTTKKARWMILRARCTRLLSQIFLFVEYFLGRAEEDDFRAKGRAREISFAPVFVHDSSIN